MSRRMSCSLTVDAVRERRKTVTRRHVDTWRTLQPGDRLTLVEKGMGLPKGAKQVVLAEVEVVAVDVVPLWSITEDDLAAEGIEGMFPGEFCAWWMDGHGYGAITNQTEALAVPCRRIEWRYLDCPFCGHGAHDGRYCDGWSDCDEPECAGFHECACSYPDYANYVEVPERPRPSEEARA